MKIYFIGAGPGDPELLTIKAARIIREADILIYAGSLVNKNILKLAKKGSKVYDSSGMSLDEVLGVIQSAHVRGKKIIARIHSGDPSIYGAIQEQMAWCEKKKLAYEVIPGVSSFTAASAALRQELTLPGISQTVIITRISGRTKVPEKENLGRLAQIGVTLVIFLSIQDIDKVVKELLCGYDNDTPVMIVFKVTWPDEKIIRGTLRDISGKVGRVDIKRQALIFVGEVLNKRRFQKSRLYDKNFSHGYRQKS